MITMSSLNITLKCPAFNQGPRVLARTSIVAARRFRAKSVSAAGIPPSTSAVVTKSQKNSKPVQAVVIGGGIGGLLAAHSLARYVDRVILLEKDAAGSVRIEEETFPQTGKRRPGVPQIAQPHQLINGAVVALETLLPAFRSEVIIKGGLPLDLGLDVHYYDYGGLYPQAPSTLEGLGVSRRFLEQCIRDRVVEEGKQSGVLEVRESSRVSGLVWENNCVKGVVLQNHEVILGDLVVDASGRRSQTAVWLEEQGLPQPRVICVDPHVASASRIVAMPSDWNEDWKLLVCKTQPHGRRGGTLLPIEGNMWQVTFAEINGDRAPKDDVSFMECIKSLPDPAMYNALCKSTPVTGVANYMAMRSELVCYHEIDMPHGLLVVGDAVQRHNAIYGQGIAATASSIVLLEEHLAALDWNTIREGDAAQFSELGQSFQSALRKHLRQVWDMATKSDMRYANTTIHGDVSPPTAIDNFLTRALLLAAKNDKYVYQQLLAVAHLSKPATALLKDPRIILAMLGSVLSDGMQKLQFWPASAN